MGKFLLISFAFPPAGVVGSLRPYRICRYLPQKGWIPEVITSIPRKGLPLDHVLLEDIPDSVRVHRTRNIDPVSIYGSFSGANGRGGAGRGSRTSGRTEGSERNDGGAGPRSLLSRIKDSIVGALTTPDKQVYWNLFSIAKGIGILRKEREIRFIFVTSPPHSSQIGGTILSYLSGIPLVVDYRDPWNDIGMLGKGQLRRRIETALENLVIRRASMVISSTQTYADLLKQRYGDPGGGKFIAITNSFEEEKFDAVVPETCRKFTMAYLGIFYPQCDPYRFFYAMRKFIEKNPEMAEHTCVRIIGNLDDRTAAVIDRAGVASFVEVSGRVGHAEAIRMAKSADLLLLLMGTSELTPKGWIPSKLIEYLACGKPILGIVPEGEAADIIRRTNSGYAVTAEDDERIMAILEEEFRRKKAGTGSPFRPDGKEVRKFSNAYAVERFAEAFNAIGEGKTGGYGTVQ